MGMLYSVVDTNESPKSAANSFQFRIPEVDRMETTTVLKRSVFGSPLARTDFGSQPTSFKELQNSQSNAAGSSSLQSFSFKTNDKPFSSQIEPMQEQMSVLPERQTPSSDTVQTFSDINSPKPFGGPLVATPHQVPLQSPLFTSTPVSMSSKTVETPADFKSTIIQPETVKESQPLDKSDNLQNLRQTSCYTPLTDLTDFEKGEFLKEEFTIGRIPIRPPPIEFC